MLLQGIYLKRTYEFSFDVNSITDYIACTLYAKFDKFGVIGFQYIDDLN